MLLSDKKQQGKKLTTEDFIVRARGVHGDKYNYTKTMYVGKYSKMIIECPEHGEFLQRAVDHLKCQCPECAKIGWKISKSFSLDEFIKKAHEVHGDKYEYDKVEYKNSKTKITITCPAHGDFRQTPASHFAGSGCSKCASAGISKIANRWLDSLNISQECREVSIKEYPTRPLDAYVAETNTVYQFHGDFWHGNPTRFGADDINAHNGHRMGDLYEATLEWDQRIRDLGYNLVVIWESDYRQQLTNVNDTIKVATVFAS